jgi:hypothetical protein
LERESIYLLSLGILVFGSVVSLSAIGAENFAVFLGVISLSYFAASFTLRPRRKSIDLVGTGLVALFLLLVLAEVL